MSLKRQVELLFYSEALEAREWIIRFGDCKGKLPLEENLQEGVLLSLPRRRLVAWEVDHQKRTADTAGELGYLMGLDDLVIRRLQAVAERHDEGKKLIPESITEKPGPLTEEEWQVMRTHPMFGPRLLEWEGIVTDKEALGWMECHHEKWDGSGYPNGLQGNEISLPAQVLSAADWFDAVSHGRPYSLGFTHSDIVKMLQYMLREHNKTDNPSFYRKQRRKVPVGGRPGIYFERQMIETMMRNMYRFA